MAKTTYVTTSAMPKRPDAEGQKSRALSTAAPPCPRNVAGQNRRGTGNKGMYGK